MSLNNCNVFGSDDQTDMDKINALLNLLPMLSYETKLGKNLRNTLRKFDKDELFLELKDCANFYRYNVLNHSHLLPIDYRIKSLHSIMIKYDKYYPSTEVKSCFNDLLGFRILVQSLDLVFDRLLNITNTNLRVVDLRRGKSNDDGYRAIHLYYQKSNYHYPIEIQLWNKSDYHFHNWLHKYSYKYLTNDTGVRIRDLFDRGFIPNEISFLENLNSILKEKN